MRICLECWGEVISSLPDAYTDKQEVMRTQDKWFLSKYSLLIYRKDDKYNFSHFLRYRKWIKKIYPEDYFRDFWIAVLPKSLAFKIYTGKLIADVSRVNQKGGHVYIFGAGRHAAECASFFEECWIEFEGFVVTSLEGNPGILRNHSVFKAADQLKDKKSLVVIAVLSSGVENVKSTLSSLQNNSTTIETITFAV